MKFTIDRQEKYTSVSLQVEKLNSLNATELKSEMVILNAEGVRNIILDLTQVTFVDSSGLSAILVGYRLCNQANGSYVVCQVGDQVAKLLKIAQLEEILTMVPTLSEAIDMVMMDEIERELGSEEDAE